MNLVIGLDEESFVENRQAQRQELDEGKSLWIGLYAFLRPFWVNDYTCHNTSTHPLESRRAAQQVSDGLNLVA